MGLSVKKDKAKHMIGSFALTLSTFFATGKVWVAIVVAVLIGLSKEIYDYYYGGVASWEDMIANILGMCFAILLIFIMTKDKTNKEEL